MSKTENTSVISTLITPRSVILVLDSGEPVTILSSDKSRYDKATKLVKAKKYDEALLVADRVKAVDYTTEGRFHVSEGRIIIDGTKLPKALSNRLLELVDRGEDTGILERFWDNLRQNPTESSREDLFSFVEANDIPISRDGCIIVYKKVRDDYWDSHTGRTHLNKPGTTVQMERAAVDGDRNNTCSSGLHVAAFEYASTFSGTRLMECKVNPRDVVAVPPDYSNQKMRVCKYQILRETTVKYENGLYQDATEGLVDQQLTEAVREVLYVNVDSEGRVRVPGSLVRKVLRVGVGRRVSVEVEVSTNELRLRRGNKKDGAEFHYIAQSDNCVRVSNKVLSLVKDGYDAGVWVVEEDGDTLVMRPGHNG